jgi:hypothetical protein
MHTTNNTNAFIEVAEDCKAESGVIPPAKSERTVAQIQHTLISQQPYSLTSDDVIFLTHAERKGIPASELEAARTAFFSKGQPCLRASPLTKTYGWGVHFDAESKIAMYSRDSDEYRRLRADPSLKHLKAMRNSK